MVFQSYALWPHMSVYDNVAFGLVERRVARGEIKRRVGEALSLVGLTDYARATLVNQLSAANSKEVALARLSSNRRCYCSMNRYRILTRNCASRCVLS